MWQTVVLYGSAGFAATLFATFGGACAYMLYINDFPNKRRFCTSKKKLTGKTVLVTGCNTGIGYYTAMDLAARGARVVMACRNTEKADVARRKIVSKTGNNNIVTMQCDLSDLESVQKFCKDFLAKEQSLHILVNNAGIGFGRNERSKQNYDLIVGTNYVGPFLLTYLLEDVIKKSAPSRIVNVSSCRHYACTGLEFRLEDDSGFKLPGMTNYPASKLLNVMHARQLGKRLKDSNVKAFSLHPGYIYEGVFLNSISRMKTWLHYFMLMLSFSLVTLSSEEGAQTSIFCAVDDLVSDQSAAYFDNCMVKEPNKLALDDDLCQKVWDTTMDSLKNYTKKLVE